MINHHSPLTTCNLQFPRGRPDHGLMSYHGGTAAPVGRALPGPERAPVEEHVDTCPLCHTLLERLAVLEAEAVRPNVRLGSATESCPDSGFFQRLKQTPPWARAAPAETNDDAGREVPIVAGYDILAVLGRGGMGVVYKARHLKLKRLVALKMIIAGGHAGRDQVARFLVEAEAVARLQHPNIVQIHEIGEQDGLPFFSLEYVDGGSLDKKLAGNPQDPRAAAALVQTLAQAMHAAHQAGVIHRDLKPANVLLARDGTPKITDFGLAKQLDSAVGQTQSGAVMGTPSYMAPEQAGGKTKEIGPAVDVYALGAILYEMLTGRPPFKAATTLDTIMQVVADEPVPPSRLQPKVPRDLETICLKCLQKDPAKRYRQALDLAEDLRRHQAGEPILARPVGALERVWRWCRRKPGLAAASAAALLGVLLALGTFAVAFFIVSESRDEAIKLAGEKDRLATKEYDQRVTAEKLAEANKQLAVEANERRKHAEKLAVQIRFDQLFSRFKDNPAAALVAAAKLLPDASRLKDRSLEDSLRLHLAGWRPQVHLLRWIAGHYSVAVAGPVPVAISADGKTALTGSRDNAARLWETGTGKPLGLPLQHQDWISAVAISADGKIALTGSADKTARLWDTATGKPLGPPLQHQGGVNAVAISADGKTVLTGSADKTARLWETATGKPLGPPLQHQDKVWAVAISPDGKTALTGSHDKTARLWQTATGKPLGPPLQHQDRVYAVAISPDGKTALTGSHDMAARLWDTATGKPLGPPLQHLGLVVAVAISTDGTTALTGSNDNTARLWQTATGKPLGPPLQHQGWVNAVAISADGKTTLTGSADHTARLWETATGKPLGPPLQHRNEVRAVAISADGKTTLTGS